MFGFRIYKWMLFGRHVAWATIRPGDSPTAFAVLRSWPAQPEEEPSR
jgi:hypothetical protein